MRGLLVKEFYNLRLVFVIYLIIVIGISFIALIDVPTTELPPIDEELPSIMEQNLERLSLFMPLIFISGFYPGNMVVSSFSYDEKAHWTPFILSVGIKKSTILLSKIIIHLIATIILMIPLLVNLFISPVSLTLNEILGILFTFFACSFFSGSISLFICSAFGSNKAIAIGSIISIFVTIIPLVFMFIPLINETLYSNFYLISLGSFIFFGIIAYIGIYFLTLHLFKKRDF